MYREEEAYRSKCEQTGRSNYSSGVRAQCLGFRVSCVAYRNDVAVLIIAHNTEDARLVWGSGFMRSRVLSFRGEMIEGEEEGLEGGVQFLFSVVSVWGYMVSV